MGTKHPTRRSSWQKLWSTESVFAVVGGLIVLGSFIIKDVVQERIRNNIASLERAVDVFDMGNRFAGISDQLDSASDALKGGASEMDQRLGFDRYGTRLEYYSNFGGRAELVYESVPRGCPTEKASTRPHRARLVPSGASLRNHNNNGNFSREEKRF
jgi:hypothetical protein